MKNLNYYLLSIPCIYSIFAYHRSASIADALIITCFCAIVGFFSYLEVKYRKETKEVSELTRLEEELKLERAKLAVEQLKEANVREKAARDARNALFGQDKGNKSVRF